MLNEAQQRRKHYATLNINKGKLCWDDDYYRAFFLRSHGAKIKNGVYSASTMTMKQLAGAARAIRTLVDESLGDWRKGSIAKITALWCAMADAGVVKNKSSQALESFCARYIKAPSLQRAEQYELGNIIEILKRWASRSGVALRD